MTCEFWVFDLKMAEQSGKKAISNRWANNEESKESQTSAGIERGLLPEEQTTVDYSIHWTKAQR